MTGESMPPMLTCRRSLPAVAARLVLGATMVGAFLVIPAAGATTAGPACKTEPGMQGQVPASDAAKDAGYCLNTQLLAVHPIQAGTSRGGMARFGKCAYVGSASGSASDGTTAGLAAVDLSEPRRPVVVQIVPGVSAQWNTTHVNALRRIVVAKTPTGFEVLSIDAGTCRLKPRGAFSFSAVGPTPIPGLATGRAGATLGADGTHEFEISPDGRTLVTSFSGNDMPVVTGDDDVTIFDIANLDHPRVLTTFSPANYLDKVTASHDFDFSPDSSRLYIGLSFGSASATTEDKHPMWDGELITDMSALTARRPGAQLRVISYLPKAGGHTVRYTRIAGHPYLLTNYEIDCVAGVPAYAPAGVDVVDIGDERHPRVVGHFTLQVNATAENCMATRDDKTTVWAHFANVDDPRDATMLFVSWMSSGLRVIDIRDPRHPREAGYLNPVRGGATAYSYPVYDPTTRVVTYADTKLGLVVVRLSEDVLATRGHTAATPHPRDPALVSRLQTTLPGVRWFCGPANNEDPLTSYAALHHWPLTTGPSHPRRNR